MLSGIVHTLRSASPLWRLDLWVDDRPWHGWGETATGHPASNGALVDVDTDIAEVVAKARTEGEITRLVFEPPRLSDLFREVVRR